MKPISFLLAASLVANAALVAAYLARSPAAPAPLSAATPAPMSASARASVTSPRVTATSADALRAALDSGEAAALRAAGLSADVARDLALGRALSKIADRARAANAKNASDARWWRSRGAAPHAREQQLLARRELIDALAAAFGDSIDLGLAGGDGPQFAFLSPEKRDALRRITQDYDEMMAKFGSGGIQLASDKEKLRLLRAERDRDIAALLTPDERLAYEMRTSASGSTVRNRYGDAIESDAEFQKIFALQKAFDEKFPREALTGRLSPETLRARSDAERQLEADLRAVVGDDRFAALRRAADSDLRNVDSLVSRLNLPPATTNHVIAARESFAAASQQINSDPTRAVPQRRAEIQALGARAKADVARALGAEAAEAYAQSSPWLSMLQSGIAYSTTPPAGGPPAISVGNQSVFPVMPAGAVGPGGTRQQVFISAPASADGGIPSLSGGGDRTINSTVQVMSFSTSSDRPATGATAPASGSGTPITVAPGQTGTPPSTGPNPPR